MQQLLDRHRALLCALLLACSGAACADEEPSPDVTGAWTGPVAGTEAAVAVTVAADGDVLGYMCGGPTTRATWTRWLQGTADGMSFAAQADGWSLVGTFTAGADGAGASLSATLSGPDGEHPFAAAAATGVAGLYRGDEACPTGLVVWSAGGALVAQGAWCDGAGTYGQVEPVMPIALTAQGVAVQLVDRAADPVWLVPVSVP